MQDSRFHKFVLHLYVSPLACLFHALPCELLCKQVICNFLYSLLFFLEIIFPCKQHSNDSKQPFIKKKKTISKLKGNHTSRFFESCRLWDYHIIFIIRQHVLHYMLIASSHTWSLYIYFHNLSECMFALHQQTSNTEQNNPFRVTDHSSWKPMRSKIAFIKNTELPKAIGLTDIGMREQGSSGGSGTWERCGWNLPLLESSGCNTHTHKLLVQFIQQTGTELSNSPSAEDCNTTKRSKHWKHVLTRFVDQVLCLLLHPFLVIVFYILFVFASTTVSFPYRRLRKHRIQHLVHWNFPRTTCYWCITTQCSPMHAKPLINIHAPLV